MKRHYNRSFSATVNRRAAGARRSATYHAGNIIMPFFWLIIIGFFALGAVMAVVGWLLNAVGDNNDDHIVYASLGVICGFIILFVKRKFDGHKEAKEAESRAVNDEVNADILQMNSDMAMEAAKRAEDALKDCRMGWITKEERDEILLESMEEINMLTEMNEKVKRGEMDI